jgi:hypothetical protein
MAKNYFSVNFQARFYDDVVVAKKYYEHQQIGLGKRFNKNVIQTLKLIKLNPYFRIYYNDIRCIQVGKFPYLIHYSIDSDNNIIIIQALICTYRDPSEAYLLE